MPDPMTSAPYPSPANLLELTDQCIVRAIKAGTLQPITTEQVKLTDDGYEFSVRWVSSLENKNAARVEAVSRRTPDFNPFLPPEPTLTVTTLGAGHLAVLNKYPVIERHLLIITREFQAQTSPLNVDDFAALTEVMRPHDGLGFYNGGTAAGSSQPHKHLQWVPADHGFSAFARNAAYRGELGENTALPWRHVFVRLDPSLWSQQTGAGERLHTAYAKACSALGINPDANPMPPYNLLMTREYLLLLPRSREKSGDVSVNALGFAGSLFVRSKEQIHALSDTGPLALLASVGHAAYRQ